MYPALKFHTFIRCVINTFMEHGSGEFKFMVGVEYYDIGIGSHFKAAFLRIQAEDSRGGGAAGGYPLRQS